jgi:hypothetical protein
MPRTQAETPSLKNRRPAHLAMKLDENLLSYAAAASAAGVGLLALAQPAEAKIIYTAANIPIVENAGAVQIDVNNDGVADFSFSNVAESEVRRQARPPLGFYAHSIGVGPATGQTANEVGAMTSFQGAVCAAELPPKHRIGNGDDFKSGFLPMFFIAGDYTSPGTAHCPWQRNKGGFLALKFVVSGQTYYGWAQISLTGTNPVITGYAYENVAGISILSGEKHGSVETSNASQTLVPAAPQLPSLGLLAKGAPGLAVWRRPEDELAN